MLRRQVWGRAYFLPVHLCQLQDSHHHGLGPCTPACATPPGCLPPSAVFLAPVLPLEVSPPPPTPRPSTAACRGFQDAGGAPALSFGLGPAAALGALF